MHPDFVPRMGIKGMVVQHIGARYDFRALPAGWHRLCPFSHLNLVGLSSSPASLLFPRKRRRKGLHATAPLRRSRKPDVISRSAGNRTSEASWSNMDHRSDDPSRSGTP